MKKFELGRDFERITIPRFRCESIFKIFTRNLRGVCNKVEKYIPNNMEAGNAYSYVCYKVENSMLGY